ncbi:hypothetical protein [Mycolicibacterium confluentis]|uniref:Uncharacterized protein n=1 Tax=Mycolicibacterium confluentis TaxID=28047 RepID=A0A7I7XX02_9MYCO|nr:hypothetical protein [Mycolicibacterium confluentis]MCV7321841.1 hypothetical protein [Mycolicibacterium confluentis]ORV32097.1 hypothetical protein AWB99_10580 [Mycolicibacterium confluentis]BBZ33654.1 hypothetical protein MCNF_22590 [Mycolicibacterium confluentis]
MPNVGPIIKMFRDQKRGTKFISTLLVVSGLGGATVLIPSTDRHAEVGVEQRAEGEAASPAPAAAPDGPAVVASSPPAVQPALVVVPEPPLVVTKDSGAQDIVKAIVGHGRAAGLNEEQIKTVIATAKIESSFRPTVSGGVQAYGGPGTAADEVIGLFQEKASFGTVAERQDPNAAITRFIARFTDAYHRHGIAGDHVQAATLAQNPQLRKNNRGIGTHYYNTVAAAMDEAAHLYRQAVDGPVPPVI